MGKRTPTLNDQAKRVSTALSKCLDSLAEQDGSPKSAAPFPNRDDNAFSPASSFCEQKLYRLSCWLNELAIREEHLAYAALLQVWLHVQDIEWPAKVFAPGKDLASRGRGRRRVPRPDPEIFQSRATQKSWTAIAAESEPRKPKAKAARRKAGDKLRKQVSRPPVFAALDDVVLDLGLTMLGVMSSGEKRAIMREVLGPQSDESTVAGW
jgi:hypothetical protein